MMNKNNSLLLNLINNQSSKNRRCSINFPYLYSKVDKITKASFKINHKSFSEYIHPLNLPKKDLYKILDLNSKSAINEIKQAYYKKAKEYHPDKISRNYFLKI